MTHAAQTIRAHSFAALVVDEAAAVFTPAEREAWIARLAANIRFLTLTQICAEFCDWADAREAEAAAAGGWARYGTSAVAASARRIGTGA